MARFDRELLPITAAEHLALLSEIGFETAAVLWHSHVQGGFFAIR